MKRRTYLMSYQDIAALQVIKERYGCESDTQALRMAIQALADSRRINIEMPEPRKRGPKPKQ